MWLRLFLAFTLVPVFELWLLLRIGAWLGAGPTIVLVIVTGLLGASLARREGAHAWRSVHVELAAGRMPGRELVEALLVLVAGVVLVTPGVLTDAVGLALLVRPLRSALVKRIEQRYRRSLSARDSEAGTGRVIEL